MRTSSADADAPEGRRWSLRRRMQGRRPTETALLVITFVAFAIGGGALGRTIAGLANAHGIWFLALRLTGVAIVFGALYLALPRRYTTPTQTR